MKKIITIICLMATPAFARVAERTPEEIRMEALTQEFEDILANPDFRGALNGAPFSTKELELFDAYMKKMVPSATARGMSAQYIEDLNRKAKLVLQAYDKKRAGISDMTPEEKRAKNAETLRRARAAR